MSAMLSRYLKDFSDTKPIASIPDAADIADDIFGGFPDVAEEPPVDIQAERSAAYAEGFSAATAELVEKHSVEVQTLELVHERELEELKAKYEQELAALIGGRLSGIAFEVADLVSESTVKAIAPVVSESIAAQAVGSLAALLHEAILDGAAGPVVVRGPASLFQILEQALGEKSDLLRHHESDDIDLAIELDGSVLVTRISAWSASLKKVLE